MRQLLRALGLAGLFALLFWMLPSLVWQDAQGAVLDDSLLASAALCRMQAVPQERVPVSTVQRCNPQDRASLPLKKEAALDEGCLAQLDGNGWLITGRSWPKCVYAVCPPEGVPG